MVIYIHESKFRSQHLVAHETSAAR
jgi:hypothetical protein